MPVSSLLKMCVCGALSAGGAGGAAYVVGKKAGARIERAKAAGPARRSAARSTPAVAVAPEPVCPPLGAAQPVSVAVTPFSEPVGFRGTAGARPPGSEGRPVDDGDAGPSGAPGMSAGIPVGQGPGRVIPVVASTDESDSGPERPEAAPTSETPVPAPAAVALFGLASAYLLARRRR